MNSSRTVEATSTKCAVHSEIAINQKAWDIVAHKFRGVCALPVWGPFDVGKDRDLIGDVSGRVVLDVGCGSGHSIAYLVEKSAGKVFGLDFSATQVAFAAELNREAIERGRVELIHGAMEELLDLAPVDLIVSVQAMGWTLDPQALFRNLRSYLKPSGRLIWSWGHPLFDKVKYENGAFVLQQSYFDETARFIPGWNGSEGVYIQNRTIATWHRYQTDAGFVVRDLLEPLPLSTAEAPDDPVRYYSAAKAKHVPGTVIFVCEKR